MEVSEFVQSALDGFNVCLFSYGQTGSGKTHTMQGSGAGDMRGMIPRAMEQVSVGQTEGAWFQYCCCFTSSQMWGLMFVSCFFFVVLWRHEARTVLLRSIERVRIISTQNLPFSKQLFARRYRTQQKPRKVISHAQKLMKVLTYSALF